VQGQGAQVTTRGTGRVYLLLRTQPLRDIRPSRLDNKNIRTVYVRDQG
jgi:hypothetical protein